MLQFHASTSDDAANSALQHQLYAAEAYNRVMEKRVQSLQRQLQKYEALEADVSRQWASPPPRKQEDELPSTTASVRRTKSPARQSSTVVDEMRRRLEVEHLRSANEQQLETIRTLERRVTKLAAREVKLRDKLATAYEEVGTLTELLHSAGRRQSSRSLTGGQPQAETGSVAGDTDASGETSNGALTVRQPLDHSTPEVPTPRSRRVRIQDSMAPPMRPLSQPPEENGDITTDAAESGSPSAASMHLSAEEKAKGSAAEGDLLFEAFDSLGERTRKVAVVMSQWQSLLPTAPIRTESGVSRCAALGFADASTLSHHATRVPGAVSRIQVARRMALGLVVESQGLSTVTGPFRDRVLAAQRELQASKDQLIAELGRASNVLPRVSTSLMQSAWDVCSRVLHAHTAADHLTMKCVNRMERLASIDWAAGGVDSVSLDDTLEALSRATVGDSITRQDISDLKRMSTESKETALRPHWFAEVIDAVQSVTQLFTDVGGFDPGSMAPAKANSSPHDTSETGSLSGDSRGATSMVVGRESKGTQVNFEPRGFGRHAATQQELTEPERRVQHLTVFRTAWFECLKDVTPQRRQSAEKPTAARRRSRSPSIRTGSPAARGRVAASPSPGPEGDGNDGDASDPSPPFSQSHTRRAHSAGVTRMSRFYLNGVEDTYEDRLRRVNELLADYKARHLPLPARFECLERAGGRMGSKDPVFRFGRKLMSLIDIGGQLAVHTGGGFILFDEYVGRHLPSERRWTEAAKEHALQAEDRAVALHRGRMLPETPLPAHVVQRAEAKNKSKSPARGQCGDDTSAAARQAKRKPAFNSEQFHRELLRTLEA